MTPSLCWCVLNAILPRCFKKIISLYAFSLALFMFFSIIGSGLCTSPVNLILCFSAVLGEANADSRWLWHLFWMWQQPTYLLGNHQCCCWQRVRRANCPTTPLVYREVDKQLPGSKRASEATQNSWGNLTWKLPRKKESKEKQLWLVFQADMRQ